MFNKLLGKVSGADTWLVMSLIIFGAFFIGVLVYLILMKKSKTEYLKNIPLNETK
jgi:cbb3-type cytochrome oxidase subunit 3